MNVLLLHTHDTGKYISPYGVQVPTDHILKFAKDALLFENMFCASPTCSPSRGAMMTSQYPHCNGLNGLSQRGHNISDLTHHMAAQLADHGFYTVLAGVQHEREFWRPYERGEKASKDLGYRENLSVSDAFVEDDTDLLEWDWKNAKKTADFIKNYKRKEPFFLSYGTHATHRIYPELEGEDWEQYNPNYIQVPPNMMNTPANREDTAKLHKSLAAYDRCFGMVMDALKQAGQYENTIIIYTTDHGLPNPYSKCGLRDAGMAVAFIMRVPGMEDSFGKVYDGLVSQIDVLPTLFHLIGIEIPDYVQGKDFSAVFKDRNTRVRDRVFAEVNFHASYEPQRCIRTERYKYIKYYDDTWNQYNLANCDESVIKSALIKGGIEKRRKEKEYLFDLLFDPLEKENLNVNPACASIKAELESSLQCWQRDTNDKILTFSEYKGKYKVNRKECMVAGSRNLRDYESVKEE